MYVFCYSVGLHFAFFVLIRERVEKKKGSCDFFGGFCHFFPPKKLKLIVLSLGGIWQGPCINLVSEVRWLNNLQHPYHGSKMLNSSCKVPHWTAHDCRDFLAAPLRNNPSHSSSPSSPATEMLLESNSSSLLRLWYSIMYGALGFDSRKDLL